MRLAGTYHPIPYLLERLSLYIPGITEKSALWLGYDKQLYTSNETIPIQGNLKIKAQGIRSRKLQSEWHQSDSLLNDHQLTKNQLSLEDEDAMNILRIYFKSPIDGLKDIISIAFPKNIFLKSLNITFKGISTQEKHILSNLLSSILATEHQKVIDERMFLQQLEENNHRQEMKIKQLLENLKSTEQLYSAAIGNIANEFKQRLEKQLNKEFILSDKTIHKLAKEHLSIQQMETVVRNAIYLAYNLNFTKQTIEVKDDYIQLNEVQKSPIQVKTNKKESDKVKLLLDKYEIAAIKTQEKGLVVNGQNIASQLNPPVTPPAITDAVKKNKSKISYLLQQYPEKWTTVREGIRPIAALHQSILSSQAI